MTLVIGNKTVRCPRCGSTRVWRVGFRWTLIGHKQRVVCENGHSFYPPQAIRP